MTRSTDPELNAALEADAAKLEALGADPGPTLEALGQMPSFAKAREELQTDPSLDLTPAEAFSKYVGEAVD